jgi:hypothetical protein
MDQTGPHFCKGCCVMGHGLLFADPTQSFFFAHLKIYISKLAKLVFCVIGKRTYVRELTYNFIHQNNGSVNKLL